MDVKTLTGDLKLAFPIRWADVPVQRQPGETDEAWKLREGETELKPSIWAYHTPISRAVFEANYRTISAAHMALFSKGLGFAQNSGPVIATLALRDAARLDAIESGMGIPNGDPATPLLAELKRLTLVLSPSANGYEMLPVDIAVSRGTIDADDWSEAESALVFFTCASWMARKEQRALARSGAASVIRGSITSLPATDFAASLRTATKAEIFVPPTQSLVPS